MTKVIMGIGIPGSGKTTTLKRFSHNYGYAYICPDDIRYELTGDPKNQSRNKEVWEEAYNRLKNFLKNGKTVVFDATFVDIRTRKNFINLARKYGAKKIQGIYIDVSLETAKDRNSNRERVVPGYVLERMYKNLTSNFPDLLDGFDSIFTLDEYQKIIEAKTRIKEKIIHKEFNNKLK